MWVSIVLHVNALLDNCDYRQVWNDFILLNNNNNADNNMQGSVSELQERMNTILYFISWAVEV